MSVWRLGCVEVQSAATLSEATRVVAQMQATPDLAVTKVGRIYILPVYKKTW